MIRRPPRSTRTDTTLSLHDALPISGDRGAEMKPQYQPLFPDDLSDEAAVALSAFLYDLAVACESRYLVQLRRSEEHTSELQSLMRISYAVFCLKKKISTTHDIIYNQIIYTKRSNTIYKQTIYLNK